VRLGKSVRAFGAGLDSTLTCDVFGVPAAELVDRIVPLEDLWNRLEIEKLVATYVNTDLRRSVSALRDEMTARTGRVTFGDTIGGTGTGLIRLHAGRISTKHLAESHGLTRQQFKRRFLAAAGLPPKLYSRITRFQALVHSLLSTDVSDWVAVSSDVGFYDQTHMINEFHEFAGSSPTVFFQPHVSEGSSVKLKLRGRPSEWSRLS
jgi:AraC-like DNA-binding protein